MWKVFSSWNSDNFTKERRKSPPLLSRSIPGYPPKIFYLSSCFCTIYCSVCSSLPVVRVLRPTGTEWEASYNLLTGDENTMTNLSCNIGNLPSWWVQTFIGKKCLACAQQIFNRSLREIWFQTMRIGPLTSENFHNRMNYAINREILNGNTH